MVRVQRPNGGWGGGLVHWFAEFIYWLVDCNFEFFFVNKSTYIYTKQTTKWIIFKIADLKSNFCRFNAQKADEAARRAERERQAAVEAAEAAERAAADRSTVAREAVLPNGGIPRYISLIWRYRKPGGGKHEIEVRNGFY